MIHTLDDVAEFTRAEVEHLPPDLRNGLSGRMLIELVDGRTVAQALQEAWPALPESLLGIVRRWRVLGVSFTGCIDLHEADQIDGRVGEVFGLQPSEIIPIGSNGCGDPIGVAPNGARDSPPGSILHFNHDR